jgi:hypothetical protein
MNFVRMLKSLVGKAPQSETIELRSIIIMQRKAQRFSEEELQAAGEREWGKKFDGKEDPMYFVSVDHLLCCRKSWPPHHPSNFRSYSIC